MKLLVDDLKEPKPHTDIDDLLSGVTVITQGQWEAINAAEVAAGEARGKPRVKSIAREDLLALGKF
jgi:ferredoxin--NADP+ reductase